MSSHGEAVRPVPLIQWRAIFAGAVAAAGLSFTLHAFAAGVGLSVMSSAPTWRDSSAWLWALSGVYLLFVAIAAFALGGYVAGRFREPLIDAPVPEVEYRDGVHGLVTWPCRSFHRRAGVGRGRHCRARGRARRHGGGQPVGRRREYPRRASGETPR